MRLEDGGGSGSAGAHFDQNFTYNDYMNPGTTPSPYISKLVLYLFQDMGYYLVNFDMAIDLIFGKNEGCDFIQNCTSKTQS